MTKTRNALKSALMKFFCFAPASPGDLEIFEVSYLVDMERGVRDYRTVYATDDREALALAQGFGAPGLQIRKVI